jgi:hypothetical protein
VQHDPRNIKLGAWKVVLVTKKLKQQEVVHGDNLFGCTKTHAYAECSLVTPQQHEWGSYYKQEERPS